MLATSLQRWNTRYGLGVPPSTGVREALQWLMLARLGILYAILGGIVLGQVFRHPPEIGPALLWAYALLALSFLFNWLSALFLGTLSPVPGLWAAHVVFDAAVTTAWIRLSGNRDSLFALLYLVQILVVSLTLYRKGALIASASAVVGYGLIEVTSPQASGATGWLVYSALFLTVGYIGGYLSEELLRTSESLKEKNRRIERLKAMHERILSNLPTGVLTVDQQMRVNYLNPAGEHILGRASRSLVGKLLFEVEPDLMPFFSQIDARTVPEEEGDEAEPRAPGESEETALSPTSPESHRALFVQAKLETGTARLQQTVEIARGKKTRILRGDVAELEAGGLSTAEIPTRLLGEGASYSRVLLFQDVTKLLHLEEKLKQHEKLAAVGQLAAGIAHEIRNPLASMSASIEMLRDSLPESAVAGENQKLMDIAIREIDRLNGLISEFLDFVKPEKFRVESVALDKLLGELVLAIRSSRELKYKIEFQESYHVPSVALANGEKLKQVIWNLIVNAVQAMKREGAIEVGCAPVSGHRVKFWVQDQGHGMSEEVLAHLYEPFFTTKDKGTGLGLATAYKIVEAHHGEIRVTSTVNVGTRFEIYLQAA